MDEGPFRMPRPAGKNANDEPAPVSKQAEQPKKAHEELKEVHRTATSHRTLDEKKPNKKIIIAAIAAVALLVVGYLVFTLLAGGQKSGSIDTGKYQAVFFTNGQVYFGKLQLQDDEYMKLKDVFYLQSETDEQQSAEKNQQQKASDGSGTKLIKLGNEIHGPEDEMIISRDQVLFYENLKPEGTVSKSIDKYKKQSN